MQLSRIVMLFAEPDYVKKVKTYDSGLNFLKSLKINLGSKGLSSLLKYEGRKLL